MAVWQPFDVPAAGFANILGQAVAITELSVPDLLWPADNGLQVIASDYSGQHSKATHEVYSFLIATWSSIEEWLPELVAFRSRWLPDGRRLSFKDLREGMRRRAYPHFLATVGALRANLMTIMVDNRVGTFVEGGPGALAAELDDCFEPKAASHSIEKIYRLALFVAMITAGLRREDQPSLWISDEDETLDSFERRERFGRLATYLTFGLTGRQRSVPQNFLTTGSKGLPEWVEDVAAIPDVAAGACAKLAYTLPLFEGRATWTVRRRPDIDLDWRAMIFGNWLSSPEGALRHVLLRLGVDANGDVRASAQKFARRST